MIRRKYLRAIALATIVLCTRFGAFESLAQGETDDSFSRHYMGNIEVGNLFPWDHFMNNSAGIARLTTTHGMVIKPWLFAGLGTGLWFTYWHDGVGFAFPLYADVRLTYPNKRWRPFADVKIGVLSSGNGFSHFLIEPAVGVKYAIKDTFGIYLSLSTINSVMFYSDSNISSAGLSINLGFDF